MECLSVSSPPPLAPRAWVEIDLGAIRSNVRALRRFVAPAVKLLAVVKADAYGHGLVPVARAAADASIDWFGVATVAEGIALREAGIRHPVLLLCVSLPSESDAILHHDLTPAIGDIATLRALESSAAGRIAKGDRLRVHLEVDTGMRRSGAPPYEAAELWRAARQAGFEVVGLMTHLADADGASTNFTVLQELYFEKAAAELEAQGARFELVHQCNSAGVLRFPGLDGGLVRPGLLLYGIYPPLPGATVGTPDNGAESPALPPLSRAEIAARVAAGELPEVRPAMMVKARVATVRSLKPGHHVGYGATYRLTRPTRIATVLIGYGDGFPRRLSNCGAVLLGGERAPILGRVCMDQLMVDVTDIPDVAPDDVAVCIGRQVDEEIRVEEIAARIDATEHEIPTCLTARLPRLYTE